LAIKLQWSSCRGHLKQESLVLNCLPEGGAYEFSHEEPETIMGYAPTFIGNART